MNELNEVVIAGRSENWDHAPVPASSLTLESHIVDGMIIYCIYPIRSVKWCQGINKIMLSMGEETFLTVSSQAKKRGISVQELLRAVIVPEWAKENLRPRTMSPSTAEIAPEPSGPQMNPYHRNRILEITVGQLKY